SKFYKDLMEVYDVGKEIEQKADKDSSAAEKLAIAQFWDCNPYATQHYGHVMFATKKITPGGHWQGITAIATRQAESDFAETVHAYMRVSIALADGFISCWDEKYRSNLIRPETVINQHIDEDWRPVLQTPPFPEYTSGHSVISAAAAEALTAIYGDGFAFNDTSELLYGLPARSYPSFRAASEEAAISRLYGGIHYMPAIAEGVTQGRKVGNYIIEHLKTEEEVEAISKK
ncbi:MAG: vanadium-dependent haloperoxidase, partial [Bacteroidota bacterium]